MFPKNLAFEQDKASILLRNQEMHQHYRKLDSIKNRKNLYLPEIPQYKRTIINLKKLKSRQNNPKDNDYEIKRDNRMIFKKLNNISKRPNQINNDSDIIDYYLSNKRTIRDKFREIKKDLLSKENAHIFDRINNTKPVIDHKILNSDFQKNKRLTVFLRKIHPNQSVSDVFINRKESEIIRKYEQEKMGIYLKEKEKGKKNKGALTGRRYISSSIDQERLHSYKNNSFEKNNKRTFNIPNIDKKILCKLKPI